MYSDNAIEVLSFKLQLANILGVHLAKLHNHMRGARDAKLVCELHTDGKTRNQDVKCPYITEVPAQATQMAH